jgi:hypothetical protein
MKNLYSQMHCLKHQLYIADDNHRPQPLHLPPLPQRSRVISSRMMTTEAYQFLCHRQLLLQQHKQQIMQGVAEVVVEVHLQIAVCMATLLLATMGLANDCLLTKHGVPDPVYSQLYQQPPCSACLSTTGHTLTRLAPTCHLQ